jgi:hypothetical protein
MRNFYILALLIANCVFSPSVVWADGLGITRIENPYVQPLEHEIAYEILLLDDNDLQPYAQLHRFEYGQALNDSWLVEAEITAAEENNDGLEVDKFEIGAKVQLSEQGELSNDWGVLFELEKQHREDIWGVGATLIGLREMGRWVATANLNLEFEFGDDIEDELESALAMQLRYRWSRKFEPALELFVNEMGSSVGPTLIGQLRFNGNRKLFWELGLLFGLSDQVSNSALRMSVEYEFY